ncbi:MAG: heme exporter protein CcmB [Candidatus Hodarchaeales archaeon]|jgi:heme exporter protein B
MSIFLASLFLAKKDLMIEFRRREALFAMGIFSFASVLIFSTLLELLLLPLDAKHAISASFLWIVITFMTMLSLASVFSRETRKSSIYGLLSFSIKPQAIFLGKLAYLVTILAIVELLTLILAIIFLDIDFQGSLLLVCLIFVVGSFDLAVAGCVVSFLTIYSKSKTLAVPILFFPLILPSILIAIQATTDLVLYETSSSVIQSIFLLLLHSVLVLISALLVIDELVSE